MKLILTFLLLGAFIFLNSCNTETPEKSKVYYDSIVSKVNILTGKHEAELADAIDEFNPTDMKKAYKKMEVYVLDLEKEFDALSDFYGDIDLLNSAKAVVKDYKKSLPLYSKIVENESITQENYTAQNEQTFVTLSKQINEMLDKSVTKFQDATHKFGEKHKIKILPATDV